jgi:hypothetical protein
VRRHTWLAPTGEASGKTARGAAAFGFRDEAQFNHRGEMTDPGDMPPRNWRGVALMPHELEQILLHATEWLTTREVERGAHGDATVTDTVVSAWVTARKVFSIEYAGQSLFPKYIFDATGQPIPAAAEVLGVFFDYPSLRLAAWFESTNSMLGGRRPREVIGDDPKLVIEAARDHLIGPVHG